MHIFRTKKFIILLAVLLFFLLLGGGFFLRIKYLQKQDTYRGDTSPYQFPGSVWASEDPEIWLYIPDENVSVQTSDAWLVYNEERIAVDICMDDKASLVMIQIKGENQAWKALIEGEVTKRTLDHVEIRVKTDRIFNGKYSTITLSRVK